MLDPSVAYNVKASLTPVPGPHLEWDLAPPARPPLPATGNGGDQANILRPPNFCSYIKAVKVTYDPAKRAATLADRGLDFADAGAVFAGPHATAPDDRQDYGEVRNITAGFLAGRLVVVVWTPRNGTRRIISMRYAHEREAERWRRNMERPG